MYDMLATVAAVDSPWACDGILRLKGSRRRRLVVLNGGFGTVAEELAINAFTRSTAIVITVMTASC